MPSLRPLRLLVLLVLAGLLAVACSSDGIEVVIEEAPAAPTATSAPAEAPTPVPATDGGASADTDGTAQTDASSDEGIANTQPTVQATPAPIPPDPFFIDGPIIRDPFGEPFLPIGTNVSAEVFPFNGWRSDVVEGQAFYTDVWKFNTLRLNVFCLDQNFGKPCTDSGESAGSESVDEIIRAYEGMGVVTIIDFHTLPFPFVPTAEERQRVLDFMVEKAELYKNNPYVWLQPYNEPLNECNFDNHGAGLDQTNGLGNASPTWLEIHIEAIDAIRATGNTNPILLNASNWGQDLCGRQGQFRPEESAILTFGPQLVDTYDNLVFDMHFYSRWSLRSDEEILDYFSRIHDAGLAVLVGEIGGKTDGSKVQQDDLKAAEAFYRLRIDGVGALSWHASFGFAPVVGTGGSIGVVDVDRTDGSTPTNLTQQGALHWEFSQNPPAVTR